MFKKIVFLSFVLLSLPSVTSAFEASYYADVFEGRSTAYGNIFSQNNHSAAICYEELGQFAYVSTADTGIVVGLDDRPNCNRHAESIDLSSSAFSVLAPLSQGRLSDVSTIPTGVKTGKFVKRNISQYEFSSLGIELTTKISNTYFTRDVILIQGKVTNNAKQAILLLVGKTTGKQVVEAAGLDSRGNFSFFLHLPDSEEEYSFVIASGNTANTRDAIPLKLIKKENITYPERETTSVALIPKLTSGDIPGIKLSKNLWASMKVSQDSKTHSVQGGFLSFSGNTFVPGAAQVSISGYTLSTPSSLDRNKYIPMMFSGTVLLDRTRDSIGQEKVLIRTTKTLGIFRFRLGEGVRVRSTYYVTLPSGDVREYALAKKYDTGDGYLKTGVWIAGNFPIKDIGTYKFELVQEDGFAYVNIPVYQGRIWGVVPTLTDIEISSINTDIATVRAETVVSVNRLRSTLGRTQLIPSTALDTLAQKKAEYMAKNNDLNHVTRDGRDIGVFAKELGISVQGGIAENIAGGKNISALVLQDGLEESGSHRKAMLSPAYTKIGIGYMVIDNNTYMVQVFGN